MKKFPAFLPVVIVVLFLLVCIGSARGYDLNVGPGQTYTDSNPISFSDGNNTITVGEGGSATLGGVLSDANASSHGTLVKSGTGLLLLNGANTFTGGVRLQEGTILLGNDGALNTWATGASQGLVTILGSGTIQTTADRSIQNRFVVADATSFVGFDIATGTTLTVSGVTPQTLPSLTSTVYGGALSATTLSVAPTFGGGGRLIVSGNSAGHGGGLASNSSAGNVGLDLTELAATTIDNNQALGGNGGGVSVSTTGTTNRATLLFGNNVRITNNAASTTGTSGDGGGVFITSANDTVLEFGNNATFSGNNAKRFGGAIYAYSSGTGHTADVILGTNTLFENNVSQGTGPMGGGAVYVTHNLSIQGNTLFRNNTAAAPGGAILMYGLGAGTLSLDTTAGDIAFSGNQGAGAANSIHLLQKTAVRIKGGNNVFFDDPMTSFANGAGNTLGIGRAFGSTNAADNFTGIVQFQGTSQFQNDMSVEVADGTLRMVSASIIGATGTFKLGSNGTVAGTGTIAFATNTINGTLAPDGSDYILRTFDPTTNSFTGTQQINNPGTVGTLTFGSNTIFDGATLEIDVIGAGNDQIEVTSGSIGFGATKNNVIELKNAQTNTTYDIIVGNQAIAADPSQYFSLTGNIDGQATFGRYAVTVQNDATNTIIQVAIGNTVQNTVLTWTGNESTTWNENADEDWTDNPDGTATVTQFADGDRVLFDTVTTRNDAYVVNLAGPMIVADMSVSGSGNYVIQGASIAAAAPDETTLDATGLLTKSGTGTLTLNNPNSFIGTVINGGTVVANDLGALGNAVTLDDTAGENATLQFNTNMNGTFGQLISGTGTLVKTGTGTLILTGANNSFTGGTTLVKEGQLWNNIADNTALTVAAGATYFSNASRNVSSLNGAGTVDMDGNSLTVNGGGDFSAGTLSQIGTLEKNGADMLTIGDVASGDLGALIVNEGTLKIDTGKSVTVTGGTTVAAGTTLNIGALPALTTGSMNISGTDTILDICGCSANGFVVTSATDIVGEFARHYVGGVAVTGTVTIDQFVNELTVAYVPTGTSENGGLAGIKVGNGGLVWNNDTSSVPNEAHGTFNVATTFKVILTLADRAAGDYVPVENWDGKTLTKTGAGVLTLAPTSGSNTYSGGTMVDRGTLISQAAGSTGSGAVNVANGAGFVLDFDGTFGNALTGSGSLTIANSRAVSGATVTIDRDNTGFTGTTTINEGAKLTMRDQNAVGDGTAIVVNGTLSLDYAPGSSQLFDNSISGNGNLVTTGNYYINDANENFSGTTRVRTDSLQIQNSAALGTSSVTLDTGSNLEVAYTGTFANALDGAGNLFINNGFDVTIDRDNSGFAGMTNIQSGSVLTLRHINAVGNQAAQEVKNFGTLVFDLPGTGSETFNPIIDSNGLARGNVVKNGAGTLILANTNTNAKYYGGSTTVNAGILVTDLATAAQVDPCGTDLHVAADATYMTHIFSQYVANLSGAGTVDMEAYDGTGPKSLTVCGGDFSDGTITNVFTFTKTSPAAGVNTVLTVGDVSAVELLHDRGTLNIAPGKKVALTGTATISDGTIMGVTVVDGEMPALTAFGGINIDNSGSELDIAGYTPSSTPIVLMETTGGTINGDFGTYKVGGVDVSDTASLNQFIYNILVGRAGNQKQIVIEGGVLAWQSDVDGTAHGNFNIVTSFEIGSGTTLADVTNSDLWYTDPVSGHTWDGKTLTKTNTGTLILSGANTYTGGTIIEDGTIDLRNMEGLGTGSVDIMTAGTLLLSSGGSLHNGLDGNGTLVVTGNTSLLASGPGFSGTANVNAGKLSLQKADSLGSADIAMADGTTLEFSTASSGTANNRTISGNADLVKIGGGTLVLNSANTYTGGTTVRGGRLITDLPDNTINPPCGSPLYVAGGTAYQALSRDQYVSVLSGSGTVDMDAYGGLGMKTLYICSGDFSNGTIQNVGLLQKNSTQTLTVGNVSGTGLLLNEGTLKVADDKTIALTGNATFNDDTVFAVGPNTVLTADSVNIATGNTTLDVTGYTGPDSVVIIRSNNVIGNDFTHYLVGGVDQTGAVSLDSFVNGVHIERSDENKTIKISTGGLVWNNTAPGTAHGNFNVATEVTVSDNLNDNTNTNAYYRDPVTGRPLWNGSTLTKEGDGKLTLSGDNGYSGGTVISKGTVAVTNPNGLGTGGVAVGNDGTLEIGYDGTYGKTTTGGGDIVKTGTGTLIVAGDQSGASGDFIQKDGTLDWQTDWNGSLTQEQGTFKVGDGRTIGGDADFGGSVYVNGNLNVGQRVTLDGADFYVNLYADATNGVRNDRITADTITVTGATLHVNDIGVSTAYAQGKTLTFTVLKTTDGITGDFSDVVGINTNLFTADYGIATGGKDYYISLTLKKLNPFFDYTWNHNTGEVGKALDNGLGDPDLAPLVTEILGMDDNGIRNAIDQLRGTEMIADARTMALWSPWRNVFNRLADTDTNRSCRVSCNPCDAVSRSKRNAWVEGYYRSGDVSSDGNARSYDSTRGGTMVGVDTELDSRTIGGVVFGYGEPRISSRFGRIEADDCTVGLYLKRNIFEKSYINAFLGYGWQDYDYRRYDFGGSYRSNFKGDAMYASIELVRPIRKSRSLTLLPLVALDYQKSWSESVRESGGKYNQFVHRGELDQLVIRVGLNAKYRWSDRLELNTRLQYGCQVGGDQYGDAESRFAMSPNSRTMYLRGVDLGRDRLNAGIGGNWYVNARKRTYVFGDYDFDCGVNDTAHTGQVGLATRW